MPYDDHLLAAFFLVTGGCFLICTFEGTYIVEFRAGSKVLESTSGAASSGVFMRLSFTAHFLRLYCGSSITARIAASESFLSRGRWRLVVVPASATEAHGAARVLTILFTQFVYQMKFVYSSRHFTR